MAVEDHFLFEIELMGAEAGDVGDEADLGAAALAAVVEEPIE